MAVYDVGDRVRVSAEFKDAAGALADPTAISFKHKDPSGTITSWTYGTDAQLVKDATGKYHADIDINAAGHWFYRFEGTGAVQAAEQGRFIAEPSFI